MNMYIEVHCPGCNYKGRDLHSADQVSHRCGRCGWTWPRHPSERVGYRTSSLEEPVPSPKQLAETLALYWLTTGKLSLNWDPVRDVETLAYLIEHGKMPVGGP